MDVRHDDDIHNDAPEGPAGASHAGGLSDDQVIRIHALAAAVRSKPLADTRDQLDLASRYARWLKNGA
jgi:hypothetical protein